MKKFILPILILILVAGGFYTLISKKSPAPKHETQTETTPPPQEKGMGEMTEPNPTPPASIPPVANPTPPPANPKSTQDDLGDVDVAPPKVFNLTGRNFSFSQEEIRVKKGDRVVINFESTDGFHDWVIDEFNAHTDRVNPGTKTSVEFIADKTGTFEYYCSVSIHRAAGMKGKLIVE